MNKLQSARDREPHSLVSAYRPTAAPKSKNKLNIKRNFDVKLWLSTPTACDSLRSSSTWGPYIEALRAALRTKTSDLAAPQILQTSFTQLPVTGACRCIRLHSLQPGTRLVHASTSRNTEHDPGTTQESFKAAVVVHEQSRRH